MTLVHLILPWEIVLDDISQELEKIDGDLYHQIPKAGHYLSNLENAFVKKHGQKLKDLFTKNRTKFETENLKDVVINKDLVNFIKKAQGYVFYIWSSNYTVKMVLEKLKLKNKFEKIITAQDVQLLKPEPEGFFKIYDPKIPKEKYLLIGDSDSDRQAARATGIDFFKEEYFNRELH